MSDVVAARPAIRQPAPGKDNWISFASGPWGWWNVSMADQRLRLQAYIDNGNQELNKALFDEMYATAANWEAKIGQPLTWERLDNRKASGISAFSPDRTDLADPAERAQLRRWASATLIAMFDAMNEPLRRRAVELRQRARNPPGRARGRRARQRPLNRTSAVVVVEPTNFHVMLRQRWADV